MANPPALMPTSDRARAFDELSDRVANEAPLLVAGQTTKSLAFKGDAPPFGEEARDRQREKHGEDDRVFWLAFHSNAVRAKRTWTVAARNRPHDRNREDKARRISNEGETFIGSSLKELERRGHLMIDLESRCDSEQHDEAEVHHRVHQASARLPHEGAHIDA